MHPVGSRTLLYIGQRMCAAFRQMNVLGPSWRLLGIGVAIVSLPAAALELNGVVISASDGKPLKRAELVLRSMEAGIPALGTITDDTGRFAFLNVLKSRYVLQASRTGFVPSSALYQNDARLGVPFAVDRDLSDLIVRLTPAATISGKVRHSDGESAVGVAVLAYREFYERNRHEYDVASRSITDDHGEYRLFGLSPGHYYVAAQYLPFAGKEDVREELVRDSYGRLAVPERTVTTFLPSSPSLNEATRLSVQPGLDIGTADIFLARSRTATIKGKILSGQSGVPAEGATVVLLREDASGTGYIPYPGVIRMLGKGEFEVRGVVPGRYALEARASEQRATMVTRQPVSVGNSAEVNADVVVRPEIELRGSAAGSTREDKAPAGAQVMAEPRGGGAVRSARIDSLGNFSLRITAGETYDLWLRNAPGNTYLKSARIGTVDVITPGLQLDSPGSSTLTITTSPDGGIVRGSTEPGANVALIPDNGLLMRYSESTANEWGLFAFGAVAPGTYRVVSWFDVPPCDIWNPARFECARAGEAVTVKESGTSTVTVRP
jgi:hypothetical protein